MKEKKIFLQFKVREKIHGRRGEKLNLSRG
jgi:hypothetical protein